MELEYDENIIKQYMFDKVQRVSEQIEEEISLSQLKEDVYEQFQQARDDIFEKLSQYEIGIMSEIEKMQLNLGQDVRIKQIQQQLQSLKNVQYYNEITSRDQDLLHCLRKQSDSEFIQSHCSSIRRNISKIQINVNHNVQQLLQTITESIKRVLDDTQYNDIIHVSNNLFHDISQFKGHITQQLSCGEEVYCITQCNAMSFATTSKPNSIKLYEYQSSIIPIDMHQNYNPNEFQDSDQEIEDEYYPFNQQIGDEFPYKSQLETNQQNSNGSCSSSWQFTCEYICAEQPRSIIAIRKQQLAVGTQEGTILIFSIIKQQNDLQYLNSKRFVLLRSMRQKIMLWDMCRMSSSTLASASFCGRVQIWNLKKGTLLKQLKNDSACFVNVKDVSERYLAISSSKIMMLDKVTLNLFMQYENNEMGYVFALERIDSKRLVFGGTDCKVRVWNYFTNQIEHILSGHHNTIYQVKLISKNNVLSCSDDGKIKIWDLTRNNHCILTLNSQAESTFALQILGSHQTLVTAGKHQTLYIWK